MIKMSANYVGEKHCDLTHGPSGAKIATDAPKDNHGRGEAFSPTDLLGAALSSCMLTVMAIAAERDGISLQGARCEIGKEMQASPRKIRALKSVIYLPDHIPQDYRSKIEEIANQCPVKLSLNSDIDASIDFIYST